MGADAIGSAVDLISNMAGAPVPADDCGERHPRGRFCEW